MALVVFTGGARSGKSIAAERLAAERASQGQQVVVAVFGQASAADPEFAARIERHRRDRPPSFTTLEVESARGWLDRIATEDLLVVECLGTLLGLLMSEAELFPSELGDDIRRGGRTGGPDGSPDRSAAQVELTFMELVDALVRRPGDTIVVTNEVGSGVVPPHPSGRLFRDLLGRANRMLVAAADAAYLCVAGRLVDLTALPSECGWPED